MKPIRIYAADCDSINDVNFYWWSIRGSCGGGGGCSTCTFYTGRTDLHHCRAENQISDIVKSYQPLSGYIELTLDSHPEVFL